MSSTAISVDGKTAIVTGASSGIGEAIAKAFASAGAKTVITGRDQSRLESVAAALDGGADAVLAVPCDLCADGGPAAIVDAAVARFGSIDILVHSAGIYEPTPLASSSLEQFDRAWAINVRAPFALTQAALPHLLQARGTVIFVSSVSGRVGFANESAYAATKSAIEGLTRSLAIELGVDGVRVNAVAPGFTASPMNAKIRAEAPAVVDAAVRSTLSGRLGEVDDVAATVLFLASPRAKQIYGVSLPVDGGYPVSAIQAGLA
jgi:NAD(P)-dependent dehydrogenase (short-subunit alcohol dehydrogenase family)